MKRITANHYQTSERYYKLPKLLFESDRYKDMKLEVKVAYAVLKDRLELSLSKGWIDEDGAIYLVYSNSKLMAILGCSKSKLLAIKKTLREYGLIDEVQQSSSEKGRMANKIYLGELEHEPTPVSNSNGGNVQKTLRGYQNQPGPVLISATSETEVSETDMSETKESESVIMVERIYDEYLSGKTVDHIKRILEKEEVKNWNGTTKWHAKTIQSMLQNEKYKGDAILQKSYTVDFLTKKRAKNEGHIQQYHIEENHEAIIDPLIWEAV